MRKDLPVAAFVAIASVYGCAAEGRSLVAPERSRAAKAPVTSQDILTSFSISNSAALSLRGDGKYLDASGQSTYANGVCGVYSKIFVDNGGGDAIMYTDNSKFADRKCADYPRTGFIAGETNGLVPFQLYVEGLDPPGAEIAVGDSLDLHASITPESGPCSRYNFAINAGGDRLVARRLDAKTWLVHSKPAPNNRAVCVNDGRVFGMDVEFTVRGQ